LRQFADPGDRRADAVLRLHVDIVNVLLTNYVLDRTIRLIGTEVA
jgi:hypothetical protein